MYFPYLRGHQSELLALTELYTRNSYYSHTIPIVEPIQTGRVNPFRKLTEQGVPFVLVVNPTVGALTTAAGRYAIETAILKKIRKNFQRGMLGIIVTPDTQPDLIEYYFDVYPALPKVIIHQADCVNLSPLVYDPSVKYHIFFDNHTSETYRERFTNYPRVLVRDGFVRRVPVTNHPPFEFFSDLPLTYRQLGYQGFGDLLTVGQNYIEKLGGPKAVAIHFTFATRKAVRIAHFISEEVEDTSVCTTSRFGEALEKLIKFIQAYGLNSKTAGIKDFEEYYQQRSFPDMGGLKKVCLKHHLELMQQFL
ncbi:sce7725 family protein [Arsenicibacter rosenii]|uniref:sce7725 family protein n=1 Tax=Arsenicibacter rosenii TaxID=1750698 RepID=UPI0011606447|nr:sce7725 family protein [Arsenicibacter rosenii]